MLKVGLTGNIGSGKSLIAEVFSALGIPVFHADPESRFFLTDDTVKATLREIFGSPVFDAQDEVDRKKLGAVVFNDSAALKTLNGILHPLVMNRFQEWCLQHAASPYILHEAAIIFESGYAGAFDRIIHISCPEETGIGRVVKRDHVRRSEVQERIRFQMSNEEKAILADFVIRNDGSEMLIPQVLAVHKAILERCA
jgi:dephospho-CoA kinase